MGGGRTDLLVRRAVRDQLGRYVATTLAVVLGVALAVGSLVLTDTLRALLRTASTSTVADLVVRAPATFETAATRSRLPAAVVDEVRGLPDVVAAEGVVGGQAIVVGVDGSPSVRRFGVPVGAGWVEDERLAPVRLVEGRPPGPTEVVVDSRTAGRLDLVVGGDVGVVAGGPVSTFSVAGIAEAAPGGQLGLGSLTFFAADDAARLFPGGAGVDSVLVAVADEADVDVVAARVSAALGGRAEVVPGVEATRPPRIGFLPQLVTLFAGLGVVVGAFVVVNTFTMLIAQRVRELGLLRALGASSSQVRRMVLGEAAVLGVLSSIIGAACGAGVGWLMLHGGGILGQEPPEGPVQIGIGRLVFGVALGVLVTCGAALVPAHRAGRITPIDAMRDDPRPPVGAARVRAVVAAALAGVAAVLLGWAALGTFRQFERGFQIAGLGALVLFGAVIAVGPLVVGPALALTGRLTSRLLGPPGRLARSNADRHRRRSAATAAALMAGIALVTVAAVVSSSARASVDRVLQRDLRADAVVEPIGDRDVATDLGAELAQQPEVGEVVAAKRLEVGVGDDPDPLAVTDPDGLARMVDLTFAEGDLEAMRRGELVVSARELDQRGWRVGQQIDVVFPEAGARSLRLGAVLGEPVHGPGGAPINLLVADAVLEDTGLALGDRLLWLTAADGVSAAEFETAVADVVAEHPGVEWNDRRDYIAREVGQIEQVLAIVAGLVGLSVLIALLGVANTLLLGVLERTREIGLLRAVGMSRRQVRRMIQAEGAILAGLGAVAGLAVGLLLGAVFGRTWRSRGFDAFAIPVPLLAGVGVLAVATGVLAATVPARRAAATDVLDAIGVDFSAGPGRR
jgi:putative ABC transport system permease protein